MKYSKIACALGGALMLTTFATTGSAQELNEQGRIVIGAEYLFGFSANEHTNEPTEPDSGPETTDKTSTIGLGMNSSSRAPATIPRLSFDYMVSDMISLGLGFGFLAVGFEREGDDTDDSASALLLAPRVGFVVPLGDAGVMLWPRAGLNLLSTTSDDGDDRDSKSSISQLALDAMFAISPTAGFNFLVGPFFHVPLGGEAESTDTFDNGTGTTTTSTSKADITTKSFGITAGINGVF